MFVIYNTIKKQLKFDWFSSSTSNIILYKHKICNPTIPSIIIIWKISFWDLTSPKAKLGQNLLRKKGPYSELFWSAFSRIRTEYGEIRSISPYSIRMWKNADRNNYDYGLSSHNDYDVIIMSVSILLKSCSTIDRLNFQFSRPVINFV